MDNEWIKVINDKYGVPTDEDFKEHADEQLMKDFIDKGGKVEKIPENKRAYNGNRIKPHLAKKLKEKKLKESGNQIRPYTKLEEQILTAGLKDGEVKE
tara:strand:- start:17 stop:310 length:294 start_codon:yes stop_codon:yes gene_type:complete